MTNISWTGKTWNPVGGCSIVSPGCTNCYAMKMANRLEAMGTVPRYDGTTHKVNGKAVWTGKVFMAPDSVLMEPLKRRKPTMYFVNSMGDLFHENVTDAQIDLVFVVMASAPQHTFQILTKRVGRMLDYVGGMEERRSNLGGHAGLDWCDLPLPNVWLGVSAEDQQRANERIPILLSTPAAVRFVSVEPQLEFIDLVSSGALGCDCPDIELDNGGIEERCSGSCLFYRNSVDGRRVNWIIQGCESGPGARPFDLAWARGMRDQCQDAGVPYFLKQIPGPDGKIIKKNPLLDGVLHQAMPEVN